MLPGAGYLHSGAGEMVVEGLPVATRSHGLTRGDVPAVGTGFHLGVAASSPVRTESQAGLGNLTSLHVTCEGTASSCVGQEADKHKQRLLPLSRRSDASRVGHELFDSSWELVRK